MEALRIEATEFTPEVIMDPASNVFEITGESRPENAGKFYKEILDWLDNYYNLRYWKDSKFSGVEAVFEFKLDYFNSTSAKFIVADLEPNPSRNFPLTVTLSPRCTEEIPNPLTLTLPGSCTPS